MTEVVKSKVLLYLISSGNTIVLPVLNPYWKFLFPRADDLIYFEDLMEETSLSVSLDILENDYADATRNKGELDERVFVNEEDSLLASGSLSGGAMNLSGSKVRLQCVDYIHIP